MTNAETIASLRERLTQAEANAERLRQAGSQEQYLEAYFLAQSLDSQLDALMARQYGPR
jgi:primosomal protein N''